MMLRNATRMAILSLLLSLVLSSGEGIRLFPIPVSSDTGSEAHSETITSSGIKRYNYAARWFGSLLKQGGTALAKSKQSRNDAKAFAGSATYAELETPFPAPLSSDSFEWVGPDGRSGVDSHSRSRGPPDC